MEAIFQFVDEVVEAQRDTYCAIADDIWDHPETRFEEFWSAQRLADALEAEGFQLTRDAGGIPNAFIASVGEGQPVIALLGEFDALAGLSQQAHSAEPTPLTPGANGHGCGHNLLGTAAFAAAVAAKAGCSSTATAALCASTVVPARKAVREKPLWCAKGCLMMSMRR
ncbi:amidohydrolase [Klebsiella pneumoniae]|nr:amidohydrolase [Klebsiella pneumoniae]